MFNVMHKLITEMLGKAADGEDGGVGEGALGGLAHGHLRKLGVQHGGHAEFVGGVEEHLGVVGLGDAEDAVVEVLAHQAGDLLERGAGGGARFGAQVEVGVEVDHLQRAERLVRPAVGREGRLVPAAEDDGHAGRALRSHEVAPALLTAVGVRPASYAADHPVGERWITEAELDAQPELVRTLSVQPPRGVGRLRLVRIGAGSPPVDLQPCGGTHVAGTAEIGAVAVSKIENKGRQNRRVTLTLVPSPSPSTAAE